eukprot:9474752-Alexandrium_andersonii.AAC.1
MRFASSDVYWRTIVEAVSTSADVSRFYPRGSNAQFVIREQGFHLVALRVEGFHPTKNAEGGLLGCLGCLLYTSDAADDM